MKLRLTRNQSIIFTIFYVVATLALRFYIEPYLLGNFWISIGIGLYFVITYWILLHKKVLNFAIPGEEDE